jgi:hypothetical protein
VEPTFLQALYAPQSFDLGVLAGTTDVGSPAEEYERWLSSATPSRPVMAVRDTQWHYSINGETLGPLAESALMELFASGSLGDEAYVWNESCVAWLPAASTPPFSDALREAQERGKRAKHPATVRIETGDLRLLRVETGMHVAIDPTASAATAAGVRAADSDPSGTPAAEETSVQMPAARGAKLEPTPANEASTTEMPTLARPVPASASVVPGAAARPISRPVPAAESASPAAAARPISRQVPAVVPPTGDETTHQLQRPTFVRQTGGHTVVPQPADKPATPSIVDAPQNSRIEALRENLLRKTASQPAFTRGTTGSQAAVPPPFKGTGADEAKPIGAAQSAPAPISGVSSAPSEPSSTPRQPDAGAVAGAAHAAPSVTGESAAAGTPIAGTPISAATPAAEATLASGASAASAAVASAAASGAAALSLAAPPPPVSDGLDVIVAPRKQSGFTPDANQTVSNSVTTSESLLFQVKQSSRQRRKHLMIALVVLLVIGAVTIYLTRSVSDAVVDAGDALVQRNDPIQVAITPQSAALAERNQRAAQAACVRSVGEALSAAVAQIPASTPTAVVTNRAPEPRAAETSRAGTEREPDRTTAAAATSQATPPAGRNFFANQAGVPTPPAPGANRNSGPSASLFSEVLRTAVNQSIVTCNRRHVAQEGALSRMRINLEFVVQPTGRVESVTLDSDIRDTTFERCVQSHRERWLFPGFSGDPVQFKKAYVVQ